MLKHLGLECHTMMQSVNRGLDRSYTRRHTPTSLFSQHHTRQLDVHVGSRAWQPSRQRPPLPPGSSTPQVTQPAPRHPGRTLCAQNLALQLRRRVGTPPKRVWRVRQAEASTRASKDRRAAERHPQAAAGRVARRAGNHFER